MVPASLFLLLSRLSRHKLGILTFEQPRLVEAALAEFVRGDPAEAAEAQQRGVAFGFPPRR